MPSAEWFVDATIVLLVAGTVAGLAWWLLRRASSRAKNAVAVAAVLLLAACIVLTDFPGLDPVQRFVEPRAVLAGVVTSILLVGAGLLAVDARSERERSKQAADLRRAVCDDVVAAWSSMLSDHYGRTYVDLEPAQRGFALKDQPSSPESDECRDGLTVVAAVIDSWVPALVRQQDDTTRAFLDAMFVLRSRVRDVQRMWDHDGRLRRDWVHPIDGTLEVDYDNWTRNLVHVGAAMERFMYRAVDEDGQLTQLPATLITYRNPVVKLPVPYMWSANEHLDGPDGSRFVRLSSDADRDLFAESGLLCAGMTMPAVMNSIGNLLTRDARQQAHREPAEALDWTPGGGSPSLRKAVRAAERFAYVAMSAERTDAAARVPSGKGREYDGRPWLTPTDWAAQSAVAPTWAHLSLDDYDDREPVLPGLFEPTGRPEPLDLPDPPGPPEVPADPEG